MTVVALQGSVFRMAPKNVKKAPRTGDDLVQFTVKIPSRWLEALDDLIKKDGRPGLNRSDVARQALAVGLDALAKRRP